MLLCDCSSSQTLLPSPSLVRRTHILASLHYLFQPHPFTYLVMLPSHHLTLALTISCFSLTAFSLPARSPVDQATQRAGVTHTHAGAGTNIPPQVKAAAEQLWARVCAFCPWAHQQVSSCASQMNGLPVNVAEGNNTEGSVVPVQNYKNDIAGIPVIDNLAGSQASSADGAGSAEQ